MQMRKNIQFWAISEFYKVDIDVYSLIYFDVAAPAAVLRHPSAVDVGLSHSRVEQASE